MVFHQYRKPPTVNALLLVSYSRYLNHGVNGECLDTRASLPNILLESESEERARLLEELEKMEEE